MKHYKEIFLDQNASLISREKKNKANHTEHSYIAKKIDTCGQRFKPFFFYSVIHGEISMQI